MSSLGSSAFKNIRDLRNLNAFYNKVILIIKVSYFGMANPDFLRYQLLRDISIEKKIGALNSLTAIVYLSIS